MTNTASVSASEIDLNPANSTVSAVTTITLPLADLGMAQALATNVVVLRGTTIGRNAVAAAGAVLTGGGYPAGWLVGGIPARPLKPLGAQLEAPAG